VYRINVFAPTSSRPSAAETGGHLPANYENAGVFSKPGASLLFTLHGWWRFVERDTEGHHKIVINPSFTSFLFLPLSFISMLCSPASSRTDSLLALVGGGSSFSYGGCRDEPSAATAASFSWSDFPILGQGEEPSSLPSLASVDREDAWSDSSSDEESNLSHQSALSLSTETLASSSPTTTTTRKVTFSTVLQIRTYDIVLGDHPCCIGGMALTCGWTHAEQDECVDLDVYERYAPKRDMRALRMSYAERRHRLLAATGLSGPELLQLEYELICLPAQQQVTVPPFQPLHVSTSMQFSLQEMSQR
jgi:hypothetical protein